MKSIILAILVSLPAYAQSDEGPKNTKTSGGRFQLIQLSNMRRDQYMIDTQTGKLWAPSCEAANAKDECIYHAWLIQDVQDVTIGLKDIIKKIESLNKK